MLNEPINVIGLITVSCSAATALVVLRALKQSFVVLCKARRETFSPLRLSTSRICRRARCYYGARPICAVMERFPTNVQDTGQLSATPKLSNCINSTVRAPHSLIDRTCNRLFRPRLITILVAIALMTNFATQTGNVAARLSFDFIYTAYRT